jgi:hypothetical protein
VDQEFQSGFDRVGEFNRFGKGAVGIPGVVRVIDPSPFDHQKKALFIF